jgi:hypothetical protein
MNKFNQKVELTANILLIAMIVLIGTIGMQKYFFAKQHLLPIKWHEMSR